MSSEPSSLSSRSPQTSTARRRGAGARQAFRSFSLALLLAGLAGGAGASGCGSPRDLPADTDAASAGDGRGDAPSTSGSGGAATGGTGGSSGSGGGVPSGTGGVVAGTGGVVAGTGGVVAGTGGVVAGMGGAAAGSGGIAAGTGGRVATGSGGAAVGSGGAGGMGGAGGGAASALLATAVTTASLAAAAVGATTETFSWKVENRGGTATGVPSLTNDNPELLVGNNGCVAVLLPGASCTIVVAFRPSMVGMRSGTIRLSATPGGSVSLSVTTKGRYLLTIVKVGGTATSAVGDGGALDCGTTCSGLYDPGAMMTLRARTTNGSGVFFKSWSAAAGCTGRGGDECAITIAGNVTVTATFAPMTNNIVFATSKTLPPSKGSAAAYDGECNTFATAAGINSAAGNDYIAWVSDTASLAQTRLGSSARGWMRRDGLPFADTLTSLLMNNAVLYPIGLDEYGRPPLNVTAFTGTFADGKLAPRTCGNWTGTPNMDGSNSFEGGSITGGTILWTSNIQSGCSASPVICMGKGRTAAVAIPVVSGRRIWLTTTGYQVGATQTPDQKCQAEKPAGVGGAAALIATTTHSAASVLDLSATYVRPDGVLVGTGADIAASRLKSGLWQLSDSTYRNPVFGRTWVGHVNLTDVGTVVSTCGDWTDPLQTMGAQGFFQDSGAYWWNFTKSSCAGSAALYCIALQ